MATYQPTTTRLVLFVTLLGICVDLHMVYSLVVCVDLHMIYNVVLITPSIISLTLKQNKVPEKLGSNPGQGSKGINFSGWHGLDMCVTVTKRR